MKLSLSSIFRYESSPMPASFTLCGLPGLFTYRLISCPSSNDSTWRDVPPQLSQSVRCTQEEEQRQQRHRAMKNSRDAVESKLTSIPHSMAATSRNREIMLRFEQSANLGYGTCVLVGLAYQDIGGDKWEDGLREAQVLPFPKVPVEPRQVAGLQARSRGPSATLVQVKSHNLCT